MTTATIDTDFDGNVDSGGSGNSTGGQGEVGFNLSATEERVYLRFQLATISASPNVSDSSLQINVQSESMDSNEGFSVRPYNTTGDDDPSPDSNNTRYTRCGNGTAYVSTADSVGGSGSKTVDLGTTADADIQGNVGTPDIFSLGITHNAADSGADDLITFEMTEAPGTDPPTLTVVYTTGTTHSAAAALSGPVFTIAPAATRIQQPTVALSGPVFTVAPNAKLNAAGVVALSGPVFTVAPNAKATYSAAAVLNAPVFNVVPNAGLILPASAALNYLFSLSASIDKTALASAVLDMAITVSPNAMITVAAVGAFTITESLSAALGLIAAAATQQDIVFSIAAVGTRTQNLAADLQYTITLTPPEAQITAQIAAALSITISLSAYAELIEVLATICHYALQIDSPALYELTLVAMSAYAGTQIESVAHFESVITSQANSQGSITEESKWP